MFKLKRKKKTKTYDFDYKILFKNGEKVTGHIINSNCSPTKVFLNDAITYFANEKCYYYNSNEILILEITNFVEREETENE